MAKLLDSKVSPTDIEDSTKQQCWHYDSYLSQELDDMYGSRHYGIQHKLKATAYHMIRLRMQNLKENCWAHVISVALRAESLSGDEKSPPRYT